MAPGGHAVKITKVRATPVNIPLEATYAASWAETPRMIRDLVESPTA